MLREQLNEQLQKFQKKNQAWMGFKHDLCVSGTVFYQLSNQTICKLLPLWVCVTPIKDEDMHLAKPIYQMSCICHDVWGGGGGEKNFITLKK